MSFCNLKYETFSRKIKKFNLTSKYFASLVVNLRRVGTGQVCKLRTKMYECELTEKNKKKRKEQLCSQKTGKFSP